MGRIEGLDVLRGGAASAVMLHHHGQYYDVLYPGRQALGFDFGPGHFGVELFFIISGFVILMTTEHKKTVLDFAVSRLTRLMPAFLAALVLATLILSHAPMPPLNAPTAVQFLTNLSMAPSLFGQAGVDLPYWTLTYELVFYVYIGIALRFGVLAAIEWFGLLAVAIDYLFLATLDADHHRRTAILLLAHYSNFFLIGMCLYRLHSGTARPITYLALTVAIAATAYGGGEQSFWAPGPLYVAIAAGFAALVWFAVTPYGKWLIWRPLVFLGRISYPLYLVHCVLGVAIIRYGVEHRWTTLSGIIAAALASLVAATVMHHLVEVPGKRWSRSLLLRGRQPASAGGGRRRRVASMDNPLVHLDAACDCRWAGGTPVQDRQIGDVRVTRIEEQMGPGFPAKDFFPEFDAQQFAAQQSWLAPCYYQPESGRLVTSIHSWLVRTGKYTILIDSCSGNHKPRPGMPRFDMLNTKYLDRLREAGVEPDEIDFVMCTHLHVDHVGWNTMLRNGKWVPTFANAKYVMSRIDHDHWAAIAKNPDSVPYEVNTYNDSVLPIVEAKMAEFVNDEHDMCGCLTLRPAPGHTPGQIRLDLQSRGKRAIFPGDALHNPVQVPLWQWNSRFCTDLDQARRTRNTLLGDCAEQGALLMPAHFAPPHAAYVKARGDRFELDWDYDNARGR